MIVKSESPLRRLPEALDRKQALFFDAIRIAAEMIDLAYSRLADYLLKSGAPEGGGVAAAAAFLDAWSVVDSADRLIGLVTSLPHTKGKKWSPDVRALLKYAPDVSLLRNVFQHLNTEIRDLAARNQPVWGTLTWLTPTDPDGKEITSGMLVARALAPGTHALENPAGRKIYVPIGVYLSTAGRSICLTELLIDIARCVAAVEQAVQTEFEKLGPHLAADTLLLASMTVFDDNTPSDPPGSQGGA